MNLALFIFWTSLSILFFCYIGYGFLLIIWNSVFGKAKIPKVDKGITWPEVTLVIAAYNEKEILHQKIENTLAIRYPSDKLRIIIVTDGSKDGSENIVSEYPGVISLHQKERKGKTAAINRTMTQVTSPITVFSDANTMLNAECLEKIVIYYQDPKVGGVAGEKKISRDKDNSPVGDAEGIYWQYESFLKQQDAKMYTVVGAAGELFSIRTFLFKPLDERTILDDFMISMQVCLQGYTIEYEPLAYAVESPSASLAEEAKRKIRISAGAYQSIGYLKKCLNPFFDPVLSFQYISRRLLRWVFCPFMLILLLLVNIILFNEGYRHGFYGWFLHAQLLFYLLALFGGLFIRAGKNFRILTLPFYFVFMNYCLVRGFIAYLSGTQTAVWERSVRLPH